MMGRKHLGLALGVIAIVVDLHDVAFFWIDVY
jgi:hypothetical protein